MGALVIAQVLLTFVALLALVFTMITVREQVLRRRVSYQVLQARIELFTFAPDGAELIDHPPEDGTPMRFAVYYCDDILGAGNTPDEAVDDARAQVERWHEYAKGNNIQ